jgi:valyl-tRNA synthetase
MERSGVEPQVPGALEQFLPHAEAETFEVPIEDRWIFSRLNSTSEHVNRAIETFRYHEAAQLLWHFFWHEFCDWYLELKKPRFTENSGLTPGWHNILAAFESALRMLHPAMPFLTEELWQRLATDRGVRPASIAIAPYPQYRPELTDLVAEREVAVIQELVTMARTLRTESRLDPKQQLSGSVYCRSAALEIVQRHQAAIERLGNVKLALKAEAAPKAAAIRSTAEFDLVLDVPEGQQEAQRKRVEKEKEQLTKNIASLERQLSDEKFLGKAPANIVEGMRQKLAEYKAQLDKYE